MCTRCKKREGSWWDYLCFYCKNAPTPEKDVIEYREVNVSKNAVDNAGWLNSWDNWKIWGSIILFFIVILLPIILILFFPDSIPKCDIYSEDPECINPSRFPY